MSPKTPGLDLPFLNGLLQPICGRPLSAFYRSIGQVFEFGEQMPAVNRKGEEITIGSFQLKFLWADWRISQNGAVLLGSTDFDDVDISGGDLYKPFNSKALVVAPQLLQAVVAAAFVVESVVVREFGDMTIRLTDGVVIESFASSGEDKDLWWCRDFRTDVSCLVGPSGHVVGHSDAR